MSWAIQLPANLPTSVVLDDDGDVLVGAEVGAGSVVLADDGDVLASRAV